MRLNGKPEGPPSHYNYESHLSHYASIILCDIPQWPNISDYHGYDWTRMSRLWDGALLKIKGNVKVPAATLALAPPTFGQLVYNIGAPITAALKVSIDGRVLRHQCLPIPKVPDSGPLCRLRDHHGRFTTTLDQFSGMLETYLDHSSDRLTIFYRQFGWTRDKHIQR